MKISHRYPHLSHEELLARFKARVDTLLGRYSDFISERNWVTDTHLKGAGKGVKADLKVVDQTIEVEVKMPLPLKMLFGSKVEPVVRKQLKQLESEEQS